MLLLLGTSCRIHCQLLLILVMIVPCVHPLLVVALARYNSCRCIGCRILTVVPIGQNQLLTAVSSHDFGCRIPGIVQT